MLFLGRQRAEARNNVESSTVKRSTTEPDNVTGFCQNSMRDDVALLVPIRVELHAALLHTNAAEVFSNIKCIAAGIVLHSGLPSRMTSCCVKKAPPPGRSEGTPRRAPSDGPLVAARINRETLPFPN